MNVKKERPILFTTEMVQAILDGRKTQTRRIFKYQNASFSGLMCNYLDEVDNEYYTKCLYDICKYGKVGDILWVRETWCRHKSNYLYKAHGIDVDEFRWKPSIHMPKEACRLRLKIKSIRVERLMDISEQDAIAEGVKQRFGGFINYANPSKIFTETYPFLSRKYSSAQMSYLSLWEKINGENSFEENPWVWVIEFERA